MHIPEIDNAVGQRALRNAEHRVSGVRTEVRAHHARVTAREEPNGARQLPGKQYAILDPHRVRAVRLRERIAAVNDEFGTAVRRNGLSRDRARRPLEPPEPLDERPERLGRRELAIDHAR
jgi:hypothetical protein